MEVGENISVVVMVDSPVVVGDSRVEVEVVIESPVHDLWMSLIHSFYMKERVASVN